MDQELEHIIATLFQTVCPQCPPGDLRRSESPDFLIESTSGPVGLEITQLFRPTARGQMPRRAWERYADEVVDCARMQYEAAGAPAVDVAVTFGIGANLTPKRRTELSEYLATLLLQARVEDMVPLELECDDTNFETFPTEIARIRAFRYGPATHNSWAVQDFDFGVSCTPELVGQKIEAKERLVPAYRGKCSEIWLVIAANVSRISTMLEIDESQHSVRATTFDRIYLFDVMRRNVIRLG